MILYVGVMHTLISCLITALSAQALASPAVTRFEIMELPRLDYPGNIFTNPIAINEMGQVTGESGSSLVSTGMHAFLWSPGQEMIDLDQGEWPATAGLKINQAGVMAGDATFCPDTDGACASQPILLDPDGVILQLGPSYTGYLVITGINEANMVIYNRASQNGSSIEPHQWTPLGGDSVLPAPSSSFSTYALDQNDLGVVVGYSVGGGYQPHIWTDGTISSLQVEAGGDGWARSINNSGIIVGESEFSGVKQATRWSNLQAQPELLITQPEALSSRSTRIYDDGTVIGTWNDKASRIRPFRIAPDGTVDLYGLPDTDLDTLDLQPLGATPQGMLICVHVNEFFQIQPAAWIPGEGWVFTNDRLVGPGSNTSEQPTDCNGSGQIITRGAAWALPSFLNPMPPGDVDGDGLVGVNDLLEVLASYGQCNQSPSRLCRADVNADHQVDVNDVLGVIDNWLF